MGHIGDPTDIEVTDNAFIRDRLTGQSSKLCSRLEMESAEVWVWALSTKQCEYSASEWPACWRWGQEEFEQRVGHVGEENGPAFGRKRLEHAATSGGEESM
jgi:hypothetical protein